MVPWEDAHQMILIHISRQYPKFDEAKGEFSHWVQKVITNKILGIWRDNYIKYARPCVVGCIFNGGGESCTKTPSGRQCSECPLYREWEKRKKDHHIVKQPLPLENHIQEASSIDARSHASDFVDYEGIKKIVDKEMRKRLTPIEWKVYKLLIIKKGDRKKTEKEVEKEAAKLLGFKDKKRTKTGRKRRTFNGYLSVLALRHRFVAEAKKIIAEMNLA